MEITLNGNIYKLREGTSVSRLPVVEWPDNIRLDGQQKRKDRRFLSAWSIDNWGRGLGREEINLEVPGDINSLWDAEDCDTRDPSEIVLSPAFNTCALSPSRGDLSLHLQFLGDIYFVETQRTGSGISGYAYKFAPPFTIGSFCAVGSETGGSINAIGVFGGKVLYASRDRDAARTDLIKVTGSLGGAVSVFGTIGDETSYFSQMAELSGTIHILHCDTKNFVRLTVLNQGLTTIACAATFSAVYGSALPPLVSDGVNMFAQLPDGIYDFDMAPGKIIDMTRSQDKNPNQVLFKNNLIFKNKKSVVRYDGTDTIAIGYDLRDGLVAEKYGEVTSFLSTWKGLFAAVQGATYSHILGYDGLAWQYYAKVPTPGIWVREMFLADSPDAIDRLWLIFGNYSIPGYFLNPLVRPRQAGTYSYVPSGNFTPPIYGGDLPEEPGAFYDIALKNKSVSQNNSILAMYGLDGGAINGTAGLVTTLSQALTLGSPSGIEAYRIQPRFELTRNGSLTGTSPVFNQAVIHYLKIPDIREMYDVEVDIDKTSEFTTKPVEAVIGSLNYERGIRTLMPFWYGQIATKYVRVLEMPGIEAVNSQKIYQSERSGFVKIRLVEVL